MNGPVFASERGAGVPVHDAHGHVMVSTTSASYVLLDDTLVALRDSRRAPRGTRTSSSVLAPIEPGAWRQGTAMRVDHGVLLGGAVPIVVTTAPVWREPVAPAEVDVARAVRLLARLRSAPRLRHELAPLVDRLIDAVAHGAAHDVETALRSLIGRGPGLTPSGDDIVTGMLAVAHRTGRHGLLARLAPPVAALAPRTTVVGAHQLGAACRGSVAEPVLAVIDTLVGASGVDDAAALDPVAHALRTLLDIGATTGADTIAGIAAGLELLMLLDRDGARSAITTAVPA